MKEDVKKKKFNKICKDIKEIKIQEARNIAKAALEAYLIIPTKSSIKKLISLRPTEPMLTNVLAKAEDEDSNKIFAHFDEAQEKINEEIYNLIKDGDVIYTHCHSSNVIQSLIYSKKKGKKFEVFNTETRPLFQGRKTATELKKAGIKVTMFVDSAVDIALSKEVTKVFLGADALLKEGVVNKVGSGAISKLAKLYKINVYVIADSWKHSPKDIKIEERDFHEVWDKVPKNSNIKIRNPAFELIPRKNIKRIVTELGTMRYRKFLRVVKRI